MATGQSKSSISSPLNFLKEGLLLPSHNPKLFAAVFSVIVASTCLLLLGNDLAIQPVADKIRLDTMALNGTDLSSPDSLHVFQEMQDDIEALLLTGAAYLFFAVIIGSAIWIVVAFAAVATYSGEMHTFGSLLGKAKTQLKGPVLTLAFVYALEIAYVLLLVATFALLVFLMIKQYFGFFFLGSLLLLVPLSLFFLYFSFVCSLSVVVAVAEPGCHGAGAFGRAWRLMKGKRRRAVLFICVTGMLTVVFSRVHTVAKTCALTNMTSGLLWGFLYIILMSGVQLFAVCAMTAFYYDESTDAYTGECIVVSNRDASGFARKPAHELNFLGLSWQSGRFSIHTGPRANSRTCGQNDASLLVTLSTA